MTRPSRDDAEAAPEAESAPEVLAAPETESAEVGRIREVYARRDRRGARHPAIAAAYGRLNDERTRRMHALLRTAGPPPDGRLLDVGCGSGYDLLRWIRAGWAPDRLAGVDLVAERASAARVACPGVDVRVGEGMRLPFEAATFDAATAVTVFSSILDPAERRSLFREMERVVRPAGLVVVYDFVVRKPTNREVVGMTRSQLIRLAGRPPDGSRRLSPLLQLVALAALVHPRLGDLAMRLAPPTHRLSYWRVAS